MMDGLLIEYEYNGDETAWADANALHCASGSACMVAAWGQEGCLCARQLAS